MAVPKFKCKTCRKDFIHLSFFYGHLSRKTHSTYHCPLAKCKYNQGDLNLRALQSHISRHKSKPTIQVPLCFKCPVKSCGRDISSRKFYLDHMPNHFRESETFTCGYPDCKAFMGELTTFRTHVSSFHSIKKAVVVPEESDESMEFDEDIDGVGIMDVDMEENTCEPSKEDVGHLSGKDNQDSEHETPKNIEIEEDPFPEYEIKDQLAKFYLKLEAEHYLPTSTVQKIAEEVQLITEFSHHHLKKSLKPKLKDAGLKDNLITEILETAFTSDPVYNIHHKGQDAEQLCTDYFRTKFWKKNYPYIEPKQYYLGTDENGRKKHAHFVSIRETIEQMLKDPVVKKKVLESFKPKRHTPNILSDITDGTAYHDHQAQHHDGKCIFINMFQDGCDNHAFGPTVGKYKPNNFYISVGNLSSDCRTKKTTIHLVYVILEKHLKNSEGEELKDTDKIKIAMKPILEELEELKKNGILIDGERIPVCLLFCQGDNLGQHFLGGFVQCFSCEFCCRFCDISLTEFRQDPTIMKPLRTPDDYDQSVLQAKEKWITFRDRCVANAEAARNRLPPGSKSKVKTILAKSTLQKLKGIHHQGIKYRPCALNSEKIGFHVCSGPSLAPCLMHDLWEGIAKNMLPKILSSFVDKGWFDLKTLNRRIESFPYEGTHKADAPTELKSLESLGGNASENATLVRLLPLIIGDLIKDEQDGMWQLYLQFKAIAEYVTAPSISIQQVLYLKTLISEYLTEVKRLLPECLYPKQHILMHYPELIITFGPLCKLSTMRFESFHVFFKDVASSCNNFINLTYTLSRKYMCKFALDHSTGLIGEDVVYKPKHASFVYMSLFSEEGRLAIPEDVFSDSFRVLSRVSVKGTKYRNGDYMILDAIGCDLKVGLIEVILFDTCSRKVSFLMNVKPAVHTFQGYYKVHMPAVSYTFLSLDSLPDYYPLPSYNAGGITCLALHHTMIKM